MSKSKENKMTVSTVLQPYEQLLDNLPDEKPLKAKLIDTPLGHMLAVSNEKSLVFLMFTQSRHFDREMKNLIKKQNNAIVDDGDTKPIQTVESELAGYFDGTLTDFADTPIEFSNNETEFTRQIWDELLTIDYGKTTTFSALAKRIGKPNGAQPVANACSRNSFSLIVPCHRIMSAGKQSATNSCVERRNWLLGHEQKFAPKKMNNRYKAILCSVHEFHSFKLIFFVCYCCYLLQRVHK